MNIIVIIIINIIILFHCCAADVQRHVQLCHWNRTSMPFLLAHHARGEQDHKNHTKAPSNGIGLRCPDILLGVHHSSDKTLQLNFNFDCFARPYWN